MARLMAAATGNFTSSGTWVTVDAATALVTEGGTSRTTLTTTPQNSANITPTSNITIDAVAIKLCDIGGTTGSVTLNLYNVTTTASVVSLTIPIADLPQGSSNNNGSRAGWVLFATGDQNLTSGSNYQIRLNYSTGSSTVGVLTNGTAANWQHMFRTKTAAAPGAADDLFVLGLWTASATWTTYTVTMDNTASTVFGSNPGAGDERSGLYIAKSTVQYGNSAATNYLFTVAGNVSVGHLGTLEMGTSGTPCTASSTMTMQFNTTTGYGIQCLRSGTVKTYGVPRTAGIDRNWTYLTANTTSGSTTYTVAHETGWKSGNTFYVSSSNPAAGTEAAEYTLSGDATTSGLTATTSASAAYSGSDPIPAYVALTTYNVIIQSDASTRAALNNQYANGDWDAQWLLINYGGMVFNAPTADLDWRYVCCNNKAATLTTWVFGITGSSVSGTSSFRDIVWIGNYNGNSMYCNPTNGTVTGWTVQDWLLICDGTSNFLAVKIGPYAACKNFYCMGGDGFISLSTLGAYPLPADLLSGCRALGNGALGTMIDFAVDLADVTITDYRAYVTSGGGGFGCGADWVNVNFVNCWFCISYNHVFSITSSALHTNVVFDGCKFGYPGAGTYYLFADFSLGTQTQEYYFYNCDFGGTSLSLVGPATLWDLGTAGSVVERTRIYMRLVDCGGTYNLARSSGTSYLTDDSIISVNNYDRTAGDHRICRLGQGVTASACNIIQTDSTTYNTAAPSEKMTPVSASLKLKSSVKRIAVADASTANVSVYVRKSAAYNGNAPRLMMKRNDTAGVTALTVCDTHAAAADAWEQLTYTTPTVDDDCVLEFYVDCDGTAGVVYVDDWAAS
jgi:hypothetical protein